MTWVRRALINADPVQLIYEHHPESIYPHWMVMAPGTYNHDFYADMFRTVNFASERRSWLEKEVGRGGHLSAGQYPDQAWFVYEWAEVRDADLAWNEANTALERKLLDPGGAAICFRRETDAMMFKLRWA